MLNDASLLAALIAFAALVFTMTIPCQAKEVRPHLTVGTQEISLSAGYLLPHRLTTEHATKQSGPASMPSWAMILTDPIGKTSIADDCCLEPKSSTSSFKSPSSPTASALPQNHVIFEGTGRLRPYIDFAGGPFYTDLGGRFRRVLRFNFILTAAAASPGSSRPNSRSMSATISSHFQRRHPNA